MQESSILMDNLYEPTKRPNQLRGGVASIDKILKWYTLLFIYSMHHITILGYELSLYTINSHIDGYTLIEMDEDDSNDIEVEDSMSLSQGVD